MLGAFVSIGLLQVLMLLANIGRAKALALALGPAAFGVAATIDQLVMSLAQIGNLSIPFTALKFLSHAHSVGETAFARTYAVFFRAFLTLAVALTVLVMALLPFGLRAMAPELSPYRGAVSLAVLALPATMMMMFFANALAARQAALRSMRLLVGSAVAVALASGVGAAVGGLAGLYAASTPAVMTVALIAGILLRPRASSGRAGTNGVVKMLRDQPQVVRTAVFIFLAVAAYGILMLTARYVALSALGATVAGLLQAAMAIALSTAAVLAPVNTLLLAPHVNRAISTAEKLETAHAFVPRLLALLGGTDLIIVLAPEPVLHVLYSADFIRAAEVVTWFIAWQLLVQTANVYQQLLIGMDDVAGGAAAIAAGHVASIVLCLAWAPRYGLDGIGLAFVVGGLAGVTATLGRLRWPHHVTLPPAVIRSWVGTAIVVALAYIGWRVARRSTADIALRVSSGFVLAAGLWWGVLPAATRTEVATLVSRLWRRGYGLRP
jgi:O-antigen/teichoic acid export membrane protein